MGFQFSHPQSSLAILLSTYPATGISWPIPRQADHLLKDSALSTSANDPVGLNGTIAPKHIRGIETGLSGLAVLLVAGTYWLLIKFAAYLVSTCRIPAKPLKKNVAAILSHTWPDKVEKFDGIASAKHIDQNAQIRLLYLGSRSDENGADDSERSESTEDCYKGDESNGGEGSSGGNRGRKSEKECEINSEKGKSKKIVSGIMEVECNQIESAPSRSPRKPRAFWVTDGSPAMKSAVQLALWQWVSGWLVIIMVTNTLQYNGFITGGDKGSDSNQRAVVVGIYAGFYVLHSIYMWGRFFKAYSFVIASVSWTLLSDANFVVVDLDKYSEHISTGAVEPLPFREIDKSTRKGSDSDHVKEVRDKQEAEMKDVENATDKAVERLMANAVIMLGISIATSFSTWTPRQASNSTTTQLGSLALLASASSGLAALLSSAFYASHMRSSAEKILEMKETIINGEAQNYYKTTPSDRAIGFILNKSLHRHTILPWYFFFHGALKWYEKPLGIIFGPAYVLLPSKDEARREFKDNHFELKPRVRAHHIILTSLPKGNAKGNTYNVYRVEPDSETETQGAPPASERGQNIVIKLNFEGDG